MITLLQLTPSSLSNPHRLCLIQKTNEWGYLRRWCFSFFYFYFFYISDEDWHSLEPRIQYPDFELGLNTDQQRNYAPFLTGSRNILIYYLPLSFDHCFNGNCGRPLEQVATAPRQAIKQITRTFHFLIQ